MIGLALVVALVMSAVAAASASAAHEWLINGTPITVAKKIHSLGLLLLEDRKATGGAISIHCKTFGTRTVEPGALGLVEKITAELLGTNDKISCSYDKRGVCESSPAPLFLAVNLPWHAELILLGTEVRYRMTSDGVGNPGWKMTCKAFSGTITDECTVSLFSTGLTNVVTGVEASFDARTQQPNCTLGGNGAGIVSGPILMESPSAGEKLTFD
jgi:hypothetical protein